MSKRIKDEGVDIDIDIRKILGLDKAPVPMPKADGVVPEKGMYVKLRKERRLARSEKLIVTDLGEYKITAVTRWLVCCDVIKDSKIIYTKSFRIADFKAGLISYEEIKEEQKALA